MTNVYNRLIEIGIILLIIFTPIYYGSVDLIPVTIIELVVLFMLLVWVVEMVVRGDLVFKRTPLDIVVLLFCAYSVISTLFFSRYTHASYMGLSLVLCISALYFIVVNHIRSRAQLIRLLVVILLVGSAHAFSHLIKNAAGLFGVSTGTMFNVGNHFAGYMVIIIPLAVAVSFVIKDTGKRVLLIFAGILMAAAMAFSLIAGAMLAFLFSLMLIALLFVRSESTRKQALILGGVVLCLLLVIFWLGYKPVLSELLTVTDLETGSPGSRISLWKSSFAMFADNPITGTGLSTFDYVYPKYRFPDVRGRAGYAHSDWLQLLTELGAIGFVIVLFGSALFFLSALRKSPPAKLKGNWAKGLVVGGLSSVGAGLAHALVEFNFHIPAIAVLFTIIVALTVVASLSYRVSRRASAPIFDDGNNIGNASTFALPQWKIHMSSQSIRIAVLICMCLFIGFSTALILRPCVADVRYQNGMKLERDLFWDEAVREYKSAIRLYHSNGDYFYVLGNVCAKRASLTRGTEMQGKWCKLALDAYHQAIELCPTNGVYYLALSNLHGVAGNPEDAETTYTKAISLDPNNAFYRGTHGTFYLKQGDVQNAIAEYKRALEVDPSAFYLILNQCYAILDTGYWILDSSVQHPASSVQHQVLGIAQEVCPQDAKSYATLAQFCADKGWYGAAFSEYRRAIALAPEQIDLWKQLSNLLMAQGKFDEAVSLWRDFLKSHPQNAQAHAQLAVVYIKQKRLDDAIGQYLTAASIDPDSSSYLIRTADLYMQQGKSAEALQLWRAMIKQNPHEAEAYYRLGRYYENRGDWISALDFFQRAIAADPKGVGYRSHLAGSYYKKELFHEAIQEWERALDLQPENVSVHLQLAEVYQRIDRQDKAKEHYRQVLKFQPENVEARRIVSGTDNSQTESME